MTAILLVLLAAPPPVDFDTDVLPVLTSAGCNAAACHGAAAGRGGFSLSLFAGDPAGDYREIAFALEGRRVNLARPEQSLVLLKPTGELDHEGGVRLHPGGDRAGILQRWIAEGAQRISIRRLIGLEIEPREFVVERSGDSVEVSITAVFDDGTRRDVTRDAVYTPDDPASIEAGEGGVLTTRRRGRHVVAVRYLSQVETVQVAVPLSDDPVDRADLPRSNFIDDEIAAALATLRLPASPPADGASLLRRLRLDLTGRLPSPAEVRQYIADDDPQKYERLVDRLLAGEEFATYWTYRLATLLRIKSAPGGNDLGALAFHNWIRERVRMDAPLNETAALLLTAEGDVQQNGAANFYLVAGDARAQAEYASELLLGARMRCANCHNHPLDRWTQDDYHGLAAIFARVRRGRVVSVGESGEVSHPRTGEAAVPKLPGGRFLDPAADNRQALADWISAEDNAYFAKAMANRFWKAMMGRGLIEPADDLRQTNPATHPELLARLADELRQGGFRLRPLLRAIALSQTYRRSSRPVAGNESDDRFYSHALVRPLLPEVTADALGDVTGVWEPYGDSPLGTRAISLHDSRVPSRSLDVLGRCSREDTCEGEAATAGGGLSTRLHLINGGLLNAKITAESGRLREAIAAGRGDAEIIEDFYLRALSRPPAGEERDYWGDELRGRAGDARQGALEDFLWALLSCREFSTNH